MPQSLSQRFWNKVEITNLLDCWTWTGYKNRLEYGRIKVKGKAKFAHRIAWELTYGKIPEGKLICHKCDNPSCNNPNHLFMGTHKDNTFDMCVKGRQRGKMSKKDIHCIRAMRKQGVSSEAIALKFNVHRTTVCKIVSRQRGVYV